MQVSFEKEKTLIAFTFQDEKILRQFVSSIEIPEKGEESQSPLFKENWTYLENQVENDTWLRMTWQKRSASAKTGHTSCP